MDKADYENALAQLRGAAELVAAGADELQRAQAFEMLAFFRVQRAQAAVSNDELFRDTAMAALTMAGRKEFLAAAALLEQARLDARVSCELA